jgi:ParB/RepB/Spo0J family partition protein
MENAMPLEPTPRTEAIELIALDCILASPLNARSSASTERLGELADSMRTSGLQQPVVVRRRSTGSDVPYELVFGHRRTMAARSLGWQTIPAIVRDMTDQQVVLAQAVENLQREDLSAMDEARGYRQLLDELKLPVDDVVPLVGKSRTQIYARLKLLDLSADAQAAVHEGRLAAEIGQLLARQPKSMQGELLEDLLEGGYEDEGEPMSYRAAKRMLEQHHAPLKNATFDRADPTYHLVQLPGNAQTDIVHTSCDACQFRSGNLPDFDPASEDGNVCMDTACFRAKGYAAAARTKVALAAKGAKELKDSWAAREKLRVGQLIDLDKKDPAIDKKRTLREVLGDQLGGAQIVEEGRAVKVAMTPRALEAALKKAGVEKPSSLVAKADEKPAAKAKGESEWDRKARLSKAFEEKVRAALIPAVLADCPMPGDLADVAKAFAENVGDPAEALQLLGVKGEAGKIRFASAAHIDKLDGTQLAQFLVLLTALSGVDSMYADEPDPQTQAICARRGIDLAAIRAEVYGEPEQPKKKGKK